MGVGLNVATTGSVSPEIALEINIKDFAHARDLYAKGLINLKDVLSVCVDCVMAWISGKNTSLGAQTTLEQVATFLANSFAKYDRNDLSLIIPIIQPVIRHCTERELGTLVASICDGLERGANSYVANDQLLEFAKAVLPELDAENGNNKQHLGNAIMQYENYLNEAVSVSNADGVRNTLDTIIADLRNAIAGNNGMPTNKKICELAALFIRNNIGNFTAENLSAITPFVEYIIKNVGHPSWDWIGITDYISSKLVMDKNENTENAALLLFAKSAQDILGKHGNTILYAKISFAIAEHEKIPLFRAIDCLNGENSSPDSDAYVDAATLLANSFEKFNDSDIESIASVIQQIIQHGDADALKKFTDDLCEQLVSSGNSGRKNKKLLELAENAQKIFSGKGNDKSSSQLSNAITIYNKRIDFFYSHSNIAGYASFLNDMTKITEDYQTLGIDCTTISNLIKNANDHLGRDDNIRETLNALHVVIEEITSQDKHLQVQKAILLSGDFIDGNASSSFDEIATLKKTIEDSTRNTNLNDSKIWKEIHDNIVKLNNEIRKTKSKMFQADIDAARVLVKIEIEKIVAQNTKFFYREDEKIVNFRALISKTNAIICNENHRFAEVLAAVETLRKATSEFGNPAE
ncbi:MAG: hypothetical protein LBI34_02175 [Puniceicoccales bacterium]|nr:hypothetical protein [Puniceicoccales bacterium]